MSREVPEGWTTVRLGNICRPRQWPTIPKSSFTDDGYTVYGANGPIGKYNAYTHDHETIAVTCRGATCGIVNLVPAYSYITGNAMALDDVDASIISQAYLYQTLIHKGFDDIISGSAQPQITGQAISAKEIILPPLPEQRRIAEVLSSVDEAIAATRAVIEQTRKVKQAVLERLLTKGIGHTRFKQTKIGEIPEGWEVMSLIDAGVRILDGDRGKEYPKADEYQDSGHCLFLSAKNVTRTGFSFEKSQFISKEKHKKLGNGLLQRLDIVVSTRGTIGNFAFYGQEIEFDCIRINSGMAILRSVDSEISPDFLFALSASELIHDQLRRRVFGSAQPQLTLDILRKLLVPMPTKQEQLSIAEKAIELREVEATQRTKLSALEQFKSALMSDLLTGRKRVTDALPPAAE